MGEKETATAADAERSVMKNKTKSNQSNDRMAGDGEEVLDSETDEDPGAASVVKTKTKSNQSNDRLADDGGISHEDDWHDDAAKLAPEKPVKSEIAIGDPGVNGNLAVSDPGVAAATPKKSN